MQPALFSMRQTVCATNPGIATVDLSPLSSWTQAGTVTDVRIDVDSPSACPVLMTINSLELGKLSAHPKAQELTMVQNYKAAPRK